MPRDSQLRMGRCDDRNLFRRHCRSSPVPVGSCDSPPQLFATTLISRLLRTVKENRRLVGKLKTHPRRLGGLPVHYMTSLPYKLLAFSFFPKQYRIEIGQEAGMGREALGRYDDEMRQVEPSRSGMPDRIPAPSDAHGLTGRCASSYGAQDRPQATAGRPGSGLAQRRRLSRRL